MKPTLFAPVLLLVLSACETTGTQGVATASAPAPLAASVSGAPVPAATYTTGQIVLAESVAPIDRQGGNAAVAIGSTILGAPGHTPHRQRLPVVLRRFTSPTTATASTRAAAARVHRRRVSAVRSFARRQGPRRRPRRPAAPRPPPRPSLSPRRRRRPRRSPAR